MGCCEQDIGSWRSVFGCSEQDIGTLRSVMGRCEQDIRTWRSVMGCSEQNIGTRRSVIGSCEVILDQFFVINDRECVANFGRLSISHEELCFANLFVNFLISSL
jgi:hypothetical protein